MVGGTEPDGDRRAGTGRESCGRARCRGEAAPLRKNREGFLEEVLVEAVRVGWERFQLVETVGRWCLVLSQQPPPGSTGISTDRFATLSAVRGLEGSRASLTHTPSNTSPHCDILLVFTMRLVWALLLN